MINPWNIPWNTSCASCTVALPVQSWHKNDQTCLLYMANQEEIEKCFHYVIEWYIYILWYLITVPSIGVSKCFQLVYLWLGVAVHIHASENCSTVAFPLANASAAHTSVWKWAVSNSIIPFWMTNWKSHIDSKISDQKSPLIKVKRLSNLIKSQKFYTVTC